MAGFSNPDAYELWMGRWSRRLAPLFVSFANLPKSSRVLDVGSGTGALVTTLLETSEEATVVGVEPAQAYVAYTRQRLHDDRVEFKVGDAHDLPFDPDSFDATLALLALQELSDAIEAVRDMVRVTHPGGLVAASQWDFENGLPMLALFWQSAVEVVDTDEVRAAATRSMVVDYPDERALQRLWREAGLVEIETERQEIAMTFADFDDYWSPFLSGVAPSASYAGKLGDEQRETLRQRLRQKTIGVGPDRPFPLAAHAWAVRGRVPLQS
jgi:ubiquinone/menaquinone biosynthesis C-methylase UbiE